MTTELEPVKQAGNRDEKGRFVKGKTGNPNGRPALEFSITEILRAKVMERPRVIERLLALAESEDENVSLKAIQYIANRIEGMPKQSVEQENKGSFDVTLKWDHGDRA